MRSHDDQRVAGARHQRERNQSASVAESVAKPTAGVGVQPAEEIVQRVEVADGDGTRPERAEIKWQEPLRKAFAHSDQEHHT